MKITIIRNRVISFALSLALVASLALMAQAEEKMDMKDMKGMKDMKKMDMGMDSAMMANWQKYCSPGPEHKLLMQTAGTWKTHMKMWMSPDSKPTEAEGMSERDMVLGGRYLRMMYHGQMDGMNFEGTGYVSYDRFRDEYTYIWMDNMMTAIQVSVAKPDPKSNVLVFKGKADEPMTGDRDKDVQYVYRPIDEDHFVFEMWDTIKGKLVKVGEIEHDRVKK